MRNRPRHRLLLLPVILVLGISVGLLSGCGARLPPSVITVEKPVHVFPPAYWMDCRVADISGFDVEHLTDKDVAEIILILHTTNEHCAIDAGNLREFVRLVKAEQEQLDAKLTSSIRPVSRPGR